MEVFKKDIYQTDEKPSLARGRTIPRATAPTAIYRRYDIGLNSLASAEGRRRIRRRRGEHNQAVVAFNKILWLALLAVVVLYGGFLVYAQKKGLFKAKPPPPPPAVEAPAAPVAVAPIAPLFADVPIENDIKDWKRALALVREGAAMGEAGKVGPAIERLKEAVEQAPDLLIAREELARLMEKEKNYAAAEREWRAVLARDPEKSAAKIRLAGVYLAAGENGAALDTARWALETDAYAKEALDIAATALMALRQPREAIDFLRRLAAIDRDDPAVRNKLGLAYLAIGDLKNAQSVLRDVLRSDPANSVALYNLAVVHARKDSPAEAVDLLIEASRRFGGPFVLAWTRSTDFDPIRDTPAFKAFVEQQSYAPPAAEQTAVADPAPVL